MVKPISERTNEAPNMNGKPRLLRLWLHLSAKRRKQFVFLLGAMLLSAFAEVASLGAVLPFLGLLTAPEKVFSYPGVSRLVKVLGITSPEQLVVPVTVIFAVTALLAGALRILLLWASTRLAYASGADLSLDIYRRTLYQPYPVHLARNSSEVISGITNKVAIAVSVLNQSLTFISSTVLLVAITFALIVIDPQIALVSLIVFGGAYGSIFWLTRSKLRDNSQKIAIEQTYVVKALQEGLGGVRDVLLDGTQPVYCNVFSRASGELRRAQANNVFIGGSPRFAMEALGMVLIALLAYSFSTRSGGLSTVLPVLGALALGAQRMLPALQQAYNAWATIRGSHTSLGETINLLDQPVAPGLLLPPPPALHFSDELRFDNVSFRYLADSAWILRDLSFVIPKGAFVAFVGSTGSGKSTTLDLLMGLLTPTQGQFLLDGTPLSGNQVRAWQRTIAHVPQTIYLADTTIIENIAFGVPRAQVDMPKVLKAAHQANISNFINELADGYNTLVGERGVRLSGGQRQRIGIARALYKQANVIVFDEATSALDNATEKSVMDAIQNLSQDLTIILIAHRLTTVQRCDTIFELDNGRIVSHGSYQLLLETSSSFRRMAVSEA